jgi:hypothetical protein
LIATMLESFKRFFAGPAPAPTWADVEEWALKRALHFKRVHEGEGFVIDGLTDGKPWRLEWGPPQRAYIAVRELRIRMELKLPGDLQMLLLSKPLMDQLERQTYENFTEGLQTQIDTSSPEEMRWLVMFPKLNLNGYRVLRSHFGMVASAPPTGMAWIEGPLGLHLERALGTLLQNDPPFVLMTLRGRTYLRTQMIDPDPASLAIALDLFETAVAQAQRVAAHLGDGAQEWPSTGSTAWQNFDDSKPR